MKNYLKLSYIIIVLLFICWELNAQMALPTFQGFEKPHEVYESGSQTFSYTGAQQTFTVTSGVSTITIKAWGAQGYGTAGLNNVSGAGGKGGYVTGNLSVTSGQVLKVYVGQQGQGSGHNGGSGGWNGGGTGYQYGGAGGGASDVRTSSYALANRVIVAAGGGGGAHGSLGSPGGYGGGNVGGSGTNRSSFTAGTGGTQSQGGSKGYTYGSGQDGSLGQGGTGGSYHNAGGGGGYYGGGAGAGHAGAGGGSSYIGGVSSAETIAGNATMPNPDGGTMTGRTGNGLVVISW